MFRLKLIIFDYSAIWFDLGLWEQYGLVRSWYKAFLKEYFVLEMCMLQLKCIVVAW